VGLFLFDSPPSRQLTRLLDAAWSVPGMEGLVPNLAPVRLPPDMDELDLEHKKEAFFRSVLPHVLAANRRIRAERARLLALGERLGRGEATAREDDAFVRELAERYRIDTPETEPGAPPEELIEELLRRVDVVPPSLALAQAAIESAWGGSRFAKLGNSLFGQWVFSADKGIAPLLRDEGANYSVARFVDLAEAVDAYVRNLNSFWAYEEFRILRRGMREVGEALDPHALADGLILYSIRREEYVDEVRKVARDNRLHRFEGKRLAPVPEAVWSEILAEQGAATSFRWVELDD
jgi:Bax protein